MIEAAEVAFLLGQQPDRYNHRGSVDGAVLAGVVTAKTVHDDVKEKRATHCSQKIDATVIIVHWICPIGAIQVASGTFNSVTTFRRVRIRMVKQDRVGATDATSRLRSTA
jgi:hypothetical protein